MKNKVLLPILWALSLRSCTNGRPPQHVETDAEKKEIHTILSQFQDKWCDWKFMEKYQQQFRWYGYVVDAANIFEEQVEQGLEKALDSMYIQTGTQWYVVSFPNITVPNEFGTYLWKGVGIGVKQVNNGLVITVDPTKKDLHARTGYGVEWSLPDGLISSHIRNSLQKLKWWTQDAQVLELIKSFEQSISPEDIAIIKAKVDEATDDYILKLVLTTVIIYILLLALCFIAMKAGNGNVAGELAELMVKLLLFPIFLMGDGDFGWGGA